MGREVKEGSKKAAKEKSKNDGRKASIVHQQGEKEVCRSKNEGKKGSIMREQGEKKLAGKKG